VIEADIVAAVNYYVLSAIFPVFLHNNGIAGKMPDGGTG